MTKPETSSDKPVFNPPRKSSTWIWLLLVAVLAAGGVFAFLQTSSPNSDELARQARMSFRKGNYPEALTAATTAWDGAPSNKLAMIAGESAQRLNDFDTALEWYRKLEDDDSDEYVNSMAATALLCFNTGRLAEAEKYFKILVEKVPDEARNSRWLGSLLSAEGRRWEANTHYFEAIKLHSMAILKSNAVLGQDELDDIFMSASFEAPFEDPPMIDEALEKFPDDPLPMLGRVQTQFVFNKYDEAIASLRKIVEQYPDLHQAHAWLGRGLIDSGQLDQMAKWSAALPSGSDRFAPLWHVKGLWSAKAGQQEAAARCFLEAIRLEPDYSAANYQLGLALVALERKADAEPFLERHALLNAYNEVTHPMYTEGIKVETVTKVIDITGKLGRRWEQFLWCHFLMQLFEQEQTKTADRKAGIDIYRDLAGKLRADTPRTDTTGWAGTALDLGSYPLPDWSRRSTGPAKAKVPIADIRFDDIAPEMGIDFRFMNAVPAKPRHLKIYEGTGGGVAAIDYDRDGWSDLYFAQAGEWPINSNESGPTDKLFRSVNGQAATDVSALAGLSDADYSQGVTFADVDSDGFSDLYVANLGQNRLYHNNGDGTFTEMSNQLGSRPKKWTTSVAGVDLNADGLPDLFDANYLSGKEVFELMCGENKDTVCSPSAYSGEICDAWINNGEGGFVNVTKSSSLGQHVGKSLGIIAGDFDGTGQISLFVSNDGIANFFFSIEGEGQEVQFEETALARGLAFDSDSRGQACMGIAADDFDGDELTDFFVTNFHLESNTLYRMMPGNLFDDGTREADLRSPSFAMLGWGTQPIDANLDGWPDIVLVNGHIDDYQKAETPFEMPPQFFQNVGGRFVEIKSKDADQNQFMNKPRLGRGAARLDWDRDGRFDFSANNLSSEAILAKNNTSDAGSFITVHLVGTESGRDAIGATVSAKFGSRTRTVQLFAGDGFQATNQRCLNLGVGDAKKIDRLVVQWPSGVRETFSNVSIDQEVTIIEGTRKLVPLPQ